MILSYTQARRLKENAIPTLHLSQPNTTAINILNNDIQISEASLETTSLEVSLEASSEHVQCDSNYVPSINRKVEKNMGASTSKDCYYRHKIRQYQKLLYKKKRIIELQRREKSRKQQHPRTQGQRHRENMWDDIMTDVTGAERTFIDMIRHNFNYAPQVCNIKKIKKKKNFPTIYFICTYYHKIRNIITIFCRNIFPFYINI